MMNRGFETGCCLVDAHCHLESEDFRESLPEVLAAAAAAGVIAMITAAVHPRQWEESARLARTWSMVRHAVGIHPWYVDDEAMERLPDLASAACSAVAIGEIGLDAKSLHFPFERQLDCFIRQLRVARELNKPVILHCRGAFNEMLEVFRKEGAPPGGIVHSFSGSPELADAFIQYGLSFSMGGTLTYRNSRKRQRLLPHIYPDHFLLETDAPDIPPVEAQGTVNTPANILYNLRAASEILGLPPAEIAAVTTQNAARIFGVPQVPVWGGGDVIAPPQTHARPPYRG